MPIAPTVQERTMKLKARVDVARGRPALPGCPTCGQPAEMLVRDHGTACCAACAPN